MLDDKTLEELDKQFTAQEGDSEWLMTTVKNPVFRELIDEVKYLRDESRGLCGPRRRIALVEENAKLRAALEDASEVLGIVVPEDGQKAMNVAGIIRTALEDG